MNNFNKSKLDNIKDNLLNNLELDTKDINSLNSIITYLTKDYNDSLLTLKDTYTIEDTCYKLNIKKDLFLNTIILYLNKCNIILAISQKE